MKHFDPLHGAGPVPSPCINVCRMDERSGLCQGCQRTLDEIASWGMASEEDKRAVWREIERRRQSLGAAAKTCGPANKPVPAQINSRKGTS